jgi:hypothetical protein
MAVYDGFGNIKDLSEAVNIGLTRMAENIACEYRMLSGSPMSYADVVYLSDMFFLTLLRANGFGDVAEEIVKRKMSEMEKVSSMKKENDEKEPA